MQTAPDDMDIDDMDKIDEKTRVDEIYKARTGPGKKAHPQRHCEERVCETSGRRGNPYEIASYRGTHIFFVERLRLKIRALCDD